jgi:ribonuclease HI
MDKDWQGNPFELSIIQGLNLNDNIASIKKKLALAPQPRLLSGTPPKRFIKINFEGTQKGNSGHTRYRGVFRTNKGNILRIYGGQIWINTNNATEHQALEEGIRVVEAQGYEKIIIEGDSQIMINMFKRLQQGSSTSKISKIWHLETSLDSIQQILASMPVIIPRHVKRSENKLTYWLSNEIIRIKED